MQHLLDWKQSPWTHLEIAKSFMSACRGHVSSFMVSTTTSKATPLFKANFSFFFFCVALRAFRNGHYLSVTMWRNIVIFLSLSFFFFQFLLLSSLDWWITVITIFWRRTFRVKFSINFENHKFLKWKENCNSYII